MTSGKSTIGPILANVLGWDFFDLDDEIVKREGQEIVEIFKDKGADYFRTVETEMLTEFSNKSDRVISLGGGSIASDKNLKLIKKSGLLIYLKVQPDILYKRLKNKIDRPLFRDSVLGELPEKDFIERIESLLDEREKYYSQADLTFETNSVSIGITVDKIAKTVNRLIYEEDKS